MRLAVTTVASRGSKAGFGVRSAVRALIARIYAGEPIAEVAGADAAEGHAAVGRGALFPGPQVGGQEGVFGGLAHIPAR